jgi:hypothetical protein
MRLGAGPAGDQRELHRSRSSNCPCRQAAIAAASSVSSRNACVLWSGPAIGEGSLIDEVSTCGTSPKSRPPRSIEETWTGAQVEADVAGQGLSAERVMLTR